MLPLNDRKTKIVATIGPASDSPDQLQALLAAGMNVARLNFSHGSHGEHSRRIGRLRRLTETAGRPLAILQDLAGPKVRIGDFAAGSIELHAGGRFYADDPAHCRRPGRGIGLLRPAAPGGQARGYAIAGRRPD